MKRVFLHMIKKVEPYITVCQKYQKLQRSAASVKSPEGGGLEQGKQLKRAQ